MLIKKYLNTYREFKYRKMYNNHPDMIQAYKRFNESENKKDPKIIKKEMKLCEKYWGCYPFHYIRNNLYLADRNLTKTQLIEYIPEFYFYRLFLNTYDSLSGDTFLDNKAQLSKLFKEKGIKHPTIEFIIRNGSVLNSKEICVDEIEFLETIYKDKPNKIFIKPINGQGGYGIKIFELRDNVYIDNEYEKLSFEILKQLGRDNEYILQYGIKQLNEMSYIYDKSVNTFRIATENINGNVRIVCAALRVGKDGNQVDNACQDGIIVGIDVDKGILKTNGTTENGKEYKVHPNTGFKFINYKIKEWEEIKKFTLEAASKMEEYTYLGWDIAMTEDGAMAIEANLGFALDLFQVVLGGVATQFNISNPNQYWK